MNTLKKIALITLLFQPLFSSGENNTADPVPLIHYEQTGERGLVIVNNPEYLLDSDSADNGFAIHQQQLTAGRWRVWTSFHNHSSAPLEQRIALRNPGSSPIQIVITAAAPGIRGHEFVEAFNQSTNVSHQLEPDEWVLIQTTPSANPGEFLGGVVDFISSGSIELFVYVAQNEVEVDPRSLRSMGYVTRTLEEKRHREARVYKGSNSNSVADLRLDWAIDNNDSGYLPVMIRPFDASSRNYLEPQVSSSGWLTHITIGHRTEATMSDMFAFADPSWPEVLRPDRPSDALGLIPNFGNWGVVYRHHGTIKNNGTRPRTVAFRIRGNDLHLAAQTTPDSDWEQHSLNGGELDWVTLAIPAGETQAFDARWVLGGPANGAVWQSVVLMD